MPLPPPLSFFDPESPPIPRHNAQLQTGFATLRLAHLDTPENLEFLQTAPEFATVIAMQLITLYKEKLDTPENMDLLRQNPQHIRGILNALLALHKSGLHTPENIALLSQNIQYANDIANALLALRAAKPRLSTQENFDLLIKHAQYAAGITEMFDKLLMAQSAIDTQENFNTLVAYRELTAEILRALNSAPLINQMTFDGIIEDINTCFFQKRLAFLCAGHKDFVAATPWGFFHDKNLADPNLPGLLFDLLPQARTL